MIVSDVSNEFDIDRVKDIPWKKEVRDKNAYIPPFSLIAFQYKGELTVAITYRSPKTRCANWHTQMSVSAAMTPLSTLGACI